MSKLWVTGVLLVAALTCVVVVVFDSGHVEVDTGAAPTKPRNVVMIVIDTLRADHLGAYGYQRNTSPAIDRFAQQNTKYNFAMSTAPWTSPSVASIFTSLYPTAHGMTRNDFSSNAEVRASVLSDDLETLAEILKKVGYHTMGLASNPFIADYLGFAQGFDEFHIFRTKNAYASAERVTARAKSQLAEVDSDSPFFLYVHYMDPHIPLAPPIPFNRYFPEPLLDCPCPDDVLGDVDSYDQEIRYLDRSVGALFDFMTELDLYDDTVIVLVGDHGTAFMEHGAMYHGKYLYNVDTRVPLIIKSNGEPREVDVAVSLIDIYPTLLEILGIPVDHPIQGLSLVSQLEERMARGVMMEEAEANHKAYVRNSGEKLILDFHSGQNLSGGGADGGPRVLSSEADEVGVVGLFDIRKDDAEQHLIVHDELVDQMRGEFYDIYSESLEIRRRRGYDTAATLSTESIEALRALGYVAGPPPRPKSR